MKKFLWFFSGEDYLLIGKCTNSVKNSFTNLGVLVLLTSICTLTSIISLIRHVFLDAPILVFLLIAFIWCLLITSLYIFLLYTISPALLPVSKNTRSQSSKSKVSEVQGFVYSPSKLSKKVSFFLRIFLIVLLALFIAQPLNLWILIDEFPKDEYMGLIRSRLILMPHNFVLSVFWCLVFLLPIYLKYRIRNNKVDWKEFESAGLSNEDLVYIREKLNAPDDFYTLFSKIRKIKIEGLVTSDFYFYKSLVDYKLILQEYDEFSILYSNLLSSKIRIYNDRIRESLTTGLGSSKMNRLVESDEYLMMLMNYQVVKYEYFADAPFRTAPKKEQIANDSEDEFLKLYYSE